MRGLVRSATAAALAVALIHGAAAAQTSLELRGGLAVGSHTATAAALDMAPAFSYGVLVTHGLGPRLGLFGGYLRTAFGCEEGYCLNRDLTVVGQHGAAGAQVGFGPGWVRAGLLFGTTRVGEAGEDPETGVGVLGAVGLRVGQGRVQFVPAVSYRWMSANTPSRSDHAVALSAELGLAVRLGG